MSEDKNSAVANPCAEYEANAARWAHLDALLGGTTRMRAEGAKWLPRESKEAHEAYANRLSRSFLFGAYEEALSGLACKPFTEPVSYDGDLPEQLAPMEEDMDLEGRGLTEFAKDVFRDALHRGMTHILVDFPAIEGEISLADERRLGVRPYLSHISGADLIGWRLRKSTSGRVELAQIRISETFQEADGDFGEREVQRIRVFNAPAILKDGTLEPQGTWAIYEKRKDGENAEKWMLASEGVHTFPGIPLVTIYTGRTGFMQAKPPLEDLGWLNIAHWQSSSDQRNILRYARTYTPVIFTDDDKAHEKVANFGCNGIWVFKGSDGSAQMLEHSGASIEAGEKDLSTLQEQMEILGLQPMLRRSGTATATAKSIDEARGDCDMQSWVRNLNAGLLRAFSLAAQWAKIELPEDLKFNVFSDFGLTARGQEEAKIILEMRKNREITRNTFLKEMAKRKLLDGDMDVDAEILALESERDEMLITPEPDPNATQGDPAGQGGDPAADPSMAA